MSSPDLRQFTLPNDTGICVLDCGTAFSGLTDREKLYAHYLAQASWYGSLICLYQCSPESPGIFLLLQRLFRSPDSVSHLKKEAENCRLTEEEFQAFMIYVSGFYANVGNYKSFGDTKFIPAVSQEKLSALIENSQACRFDPTGLKELWEKVKEPMYSLSAKVQQLGLGEKGTSTYFSANCEQKDAELAQEFLDAKELSAYNTRLFKLDEREYEVRLASQATQDQPDSGDQSDLSILGNHSFTPKDQSQPITFHVTRGDYSPLMQLLVENLTKAKEFAQNDNERNMLQQYVRCFSLGSIEAHKEGSRHWIRNKGPIIETYIGFIESYRDPFGVRGEFEGFVACVNKEMSAKFGELVARAEDFLPMLPWTPAYEKDTFLRPDFTSLDVLCFGSSGIPAGINIPNYDDIRQSEGFKNVSLGNVLSAGYKDTKVTFLTESDKQLYTEYKAPSFEVQVGLHELLGHGSGKLFVQKSDGSFNFDENQVTNLVTGKKVESWYKDKETWDSKFSSLSSSYEECRAECVGIYLCIHPEILKIFGHEGDQAEDIMYVNWLNMVRAGLLALEFYSPETDKWRQAHMQARYVILRVLLEAGDDLVTIETLNNPEDGEQDLVIRLDRSKVKTVGRLAIGEFLKKLQVYKSVADYPSAKALYDHFSSVHQCENPPFLSLRSIVLARKQPRKMFVQSNTVPKGESVELLSYPASPEGMVTSFRDRFQSDIDVAVRQLWDKDARFF